ncbi:MAG TPA: Rv3235 family protein [Arthrobacter sp.]|nr:Rv3235 family protein [Arthrobacter sp.]
MKAQTAVQQSQTDPALKAVQASGKSDAASQHESEHAPELTAKRAGQLIPGQKYAPVIRLKPRPEQGTPSAPEDSGSSPAEVIDIDSTEIRRRVMAISRSITQAALEVLAGTRPINQLSRWLDPSSYEKLQLRSRMVRAQRERRRSVNRSKTGPLHRSPQIRSARLCRINSEVYEATLVVVEQSRVRAVALRLEQRKDVWKVTALEIG